MSFHNNFAKWEKMTKKENCPVCNNLPMPDGMVDVVELPSSWLNAEPTECLKGACYLTSKLHVVELYEFSDNELLNLMKDVKLCAKALKKVTNAVKINYEIHGNTIPHFHVHLYPRYMDDPFPSQPINSNQKSSDVYKEGEFEAFVEMMRQELVT